MLKIYENCVNVSNHFGIQDFRVHVNQITCSLFLNLSLSRHPILEGRDGAPGAKGVDMLGNNCSHYLYYLPIIRTEEFPRQLSQLRTSFRSGDRPKGEKGKGRKGKGWKLRPHRTLGSCRRFSEMSWCAHWGPEDGKGRRDWEQVFCCQIGDALN